MFKIIKNLGDFPITLIQFLYRLKFDTKNKLSGAESNNSPQESK